MNVLVFGATSAVAAEVAALCAARGDRLHLVGRNPAKLAAVAVRCGPRASTEVADFDDLSANEALVERSIAELGSVDLVLVAHGDLRDQIASERSFTEAEATLRTNFLSVVSLVIPLANYFEKKRAGQLAVIASVAGDRGRPRNYTYGAAKGALTIYLQGVRTRLFPSNVHITTIKLGPVDSPMTRDHEKNVLFGKPPSVAKQILKAIDERVAEAYVPHVWAAIMPVVKHMPERLIQKLSFLSGR